jgi:hypothetical protein
MGASWAARLGTYVRPSGTSVVGLTSPSMVVAVGVS